ncbi:MAG: pyridoxal phosphate-dependent aminotransferase [Bdellovibrionales bacterium]
MISERVKKIKSSPTLALAAQAQEMIAKGEDVISLSVGEPDWNTLSDAIEGAIEAIHQGKTKYAPSNGYPSLRKAIAKQFKDDFGLEFSADEVTVSAGGKFILYSALQSICNPGDEVLVLAPYWVSYPTMIEMSEGVPKFCICEEKNGFKPTAQDLKNALTSKTKALILNFPSNPTGASLNRKELEDIVQVVEQFPNLIVITDDIYNRLIFDGSRVAPHILQIAPQLRSRTIIVNGASKSYSMTGWRVGWALGPKEVIQAMTKLQSQTVSAAASFSMLGVQRVMENGEQGLSKKVALLKSRCSKAVAQIRAIKGLSVVEPEGAFYLWVNIKDVLNKKSQGEAIGTSSKFSQLLLAQEKVAVVPGIEFGMEGYFRMSFALDEQRILEAITRLSHFVGGLS